VNPLVLIVEDEEDLLPPLIFALRKEGFDTLTATTGEMGLTLARRDRPDVILLDWMLPDTSGTEVCRALRRDPVTEGLPIIMVTARSEEIDRVVGFEVGVDDYVSKPFSTRELVLRIRAVLRRSPDASLSAGAFRLDPSEMSVEVDRQGVSLTPAEFRLLAHLVSTPGVVFTREQLIDVAWDEDGTPASTRAVDSVIKRLRKKLGEHQACIEAVRGMGYRFTP